MLSATAVEQHLVYLLNRARHDPAAYQVEVGQSLGISSHAARPPLAVSEILMETASFKAQERATHPYTGHQSTVGDQWWPNQLVREFGYDLPLTIQIGPNEFIPIPDSGGPTANSIEANAAGTASAEATLHAWLGSTSHRALLLGEAPLYSQWREIGVGYVDEPSQASRHFWTAHAARTTDDSPFVTGVVFNDHNGNERYDPGEGLAGVTIRVGATEVVTNEAGGWAAQVAPGEYVVTASGGPLVGQPFVALTVSAENRAVDFISGQTTGWVDFTPYANTPPILDASAPILLPPVLSSSQAPIGFPVAALTTGRVTDPDPASRAGIGVTAANPAGLGEWQYSLDAGGSWQPLDASSASAARLLRSTDWVRFVPSGPGGGTASLWFQAWDETVGIAGSLVDPTTFSSGGSPFSVATATGTIAIVATNDAPLLDPGILMLLPDVPEDSLNPLGATVASLLTVAASDAQPGTRLGMAVIGGSDTPNGTWQWARSADHAWTNLPAVTPATALLLGPDASLRFLPAPDYEGTQQLSVRAWDLSDDRASGSLADLSSESAAGGGTAFSTSVGTILATVTPINDAPRINPLASAFRLNPVAPDTGLNSSTPTTRISDILGNAVTDVDANAQRGIALVGGGGNGTLWLKRITGGWATGPLTPLSPWLLYDTDEIAFVPAAGFTGTVHLEFRAWDRSMFDRKINNNEAPLTSPTSYGGTTAFSPELMTATIHVGGIGLSPTVAFDQVAARVSNGRENVGLIFSTPVAGIDVGDFSLTRDGEPVSLAGVSVTGQGTEWFLQGLGARTYPEGTYVLTLFSSGTGIATETGLRLSADASQSWEVDRAGFGLTGVSLNENAPAGTPIGEFFQIDPGLGETFTYALVSGEGDTHNDSFSLEDDKTLVSKAPFDYEVVSVARIRVRSTRSSGEFTEKSFRIQIVNVDEAPPLITSGNSAGTWPEDTPLGTLVYQATAIDDADVSSGLQFSIGGPHASTFTIDPRTGAVRLAQSLDFETRAAYEFLVIATDGAGNRAELLVTLQVTNVDEPPIDLILHPAFVSKFGRSGTLVGTLTAVDPDGGKSYYFDFASGHQWPDNGYFYIDGDKLYSHGFFASVDRTLFITRIRIRDGGAVVFEKTVPIIVTDGNDPPLSVTVTDGIDTLGEGTDVSAAIPVGTIAIEDDEIGWHTITLSGPDADAFEVIDHVLFLRAGTVLNRAVRPELVVHISVIDATISDSQPVSTVFTLSVSPAASPPPPRLTSIHVRGSSWNVAFEQALEAAGVGAPGRGYRLPDGANQLANPAMVTWSNVNQVVVEFDADVTVTVGSLSLLGPGNSHLPASAVTAIDDRTYRWTIPALDSGRYLLVLDAASIQSHSGVSLDGEWLTGTSLYGLAGDGQPGGDTHFRFHVLRGDLNRNGGVNLSDVTAIRTRTGLTTAANYRFDVNGSGSVNAADITIVRANNGRLLANFTAPTLPPSSQGLALAPEQPSDTTGDGDSHDKAALSQPASSLWHLWAAGLAAQNTSVEEAPSKTLSGSR